MNMVCVPFPTKSNFGKKEIKEDVYAFLQDVRSIELDSFESF